MVMWCISNYHSEITKLIDIYIKTKTMDKTAQALDVFLNNTETKSVSTDGKENEVCNLQTGECYTIRSKDGIVERINKKYLVEDGRQLLID
jgi:hypothetical protein